MRLFKWQLVPRDELENLQALSAQETYAPARGQARFDDAELLLLAKNFTRAKTELQDAVQRLESENLSLQAKLDTLEQERSSVENARKEARLEHMQTDFIAAASHEIKTPLAGIEALSDALEMALEDENLEAASTFISHVKVETKRMRKLSESLLDLSRFNENPDSDSVSKLRNTVNNSSIMHSKSATAKGLTLDIKFAADLGSAALAKISPTDLSIILDNLLDNAIHYTKTGSIELHIELCSETQMWLFTLSDTGEGIAAHDQAYVFDRFYRADRSRSRDNGGSGLGLALVKKAIERWGGDIELQSELGVGSTFTFRLPAA